MKKRLNFTPSNVLKDRLDKAIKLYKAGVASDYTIKDFLTTICKLKPNDIDNKYSAMDNCHASVTNKKHSIQNSF